MNLMSIHTVDREIFTLKIICVRIFRFKFSRFRSIHELFITVDDCNMDERLESSWHLVYSTRYQESQGSLAVVVDRTFNSGSVDLRTSLITDHHCVILFFACLIFAVGLNREIILTAKFSQSMVLSYHDISPNALFFVLRSKQQVASVFT